ncbi:MAG: DUF3575 domain-containing protein [Muribaculaceae bacterium]|nr:DUF3575 domain-containing protein [Muribaculaceae bacterium]
MLAQKYKLKLCLPIFLSALASGISAQTAAIKTNLLDDVALNVNAGVEVGVAPQWTIDVPASFNAWTLSHDRRWKHWYIQPGSRYWFCDRFAGHFVGMHAHGGQYNIGGIDGKINLLGTDFRKLKDSRYQGWFVGGGISYGYAWIINRHWNIEGEIGVGYSYTRYDRFRCAGCGKKIAANQPHNYVGLTKATVNIVYIF